MVNSNFTYPITLQEQREGGYLVRFPDFPEAITQGENKKEAFQAAADCLEEAVANRIVMGLDIPLNRHSTRRVNFVSLSITLAAKCALYLAMKKAKCKNVNLAKALKCDEKEVRRLLDPRYKSKISKIEEAIRALGERLTLSISNNYVISNFSSQKSDNHYHHSI